MIVFFFLASPHLVRVFVLRTQVDEIQICCINCGRFNERGFRLNWLCVLCLISEKKEQPDNGPHAM